ncbi:hypothetical protein C4K37_4719 [Pseudomonas chlororaphis subsp. piscium]|uniref:Uncharacterized protein n=1 Tax=Pseudomonas chlororaphis TaxID=587753 RepID=A0AAX3FS41_9PSED|nr:hypothetical protein C4K37_4719 [Pseudomonas chlororaphis subsp. piscium]AZC45643.1 hypothetical protein C4K36_4732 [Pseudomonas chlororaphis subsp. piscium]VEF73563.1 Uncharacterised protein [Pseudomonas chlororaphis]
MPQSCFKCAIAEHLSKAVGVSILRGRLNPVKKKARI